MRLDDHGIKIELPSTWSGRIFTHAGDADSDGRPTLHAGSFAIPMDDEADWGSGAIAAMAADDVFLAIAEFGPDVMLPTADPDVLLSIATGAIGMHQVARSERLGVAAPPVILDETRFAREAVYCPATVRNASALQATFTMAGRPFVAYCVVGDHARVSTLVKQLNDVLATLTVSPTVSAVLRVAVTPSPAIAFSNIDLPIVTRAPSTGTYSGTGDGFQSRARPDTSDSDVWPVKVTVGGQYRAGDCLHEFRLTGSVRTEGVSVIAPDRPPPSAPTLFVPQSRFVFPEMTTIPSFGQLFIGDDPIGMPAVIAAAYDAAGTPVVSPCAVPRVARFEIISSFMLRYVDLPQTPDFHTDLVG